MTEPAFEIGATGLDTAKIVEEIQAAVARKAEEGTYADARIAKAERTNLVNLRNEKEFLEFYLKCLRDSVFVDISDFKIHERRRFFAPLLIGFKRTIWKLLKFYTYRLWSQQNQVNGLLVTALEGLDEQYGKKIAELERQIREIKERR